MAALGDVISGILGAIPSIIAWGNTISLPLSLSAVVALWFQPNFALRNYGWRAKLGLTAISFPLLGILSIPGSVFVLTRRFRSTPPPPSPSPPATDGSL